MTSYLSLISQGAAVLVPMTVLVKVFSPLAETWRPLLYGLVVPAITVVSLFAVRQQNLKRFMAFFISQAGYLMLGVIGGTAEGITALVYYLFAIWLFSE